MVSPTTDQGIGFGMIIRASLGRRALILSMSPTRSRTRGQRGTLTSKTKTPRKSWNLRKRNPVRRKHSRRY